MRKTKGFTLVEILVVVLILSVLVAVSLPLYTGAVDKSKFGTMLPISLSIKNAEENYFLTKGFYTDKINDLSLSVADQSSEKQDLIYEIDTSNKGDQFNVLKITHKGLSNVRLAFYFDNNARFQGQLHCEAKDGDERATKLCKKTLSGKEVYNTEDGYIAYLLNAELNAYTCSYSGGVWSEGKKKCYDNINAKCADLGLSVITSSKCGYTDSKGKVVSEDEICRSTKNNGCNGTIIENGGQCLSDNNGNGCKDVTIKNGGECIVYGSIAGCTKATTGINVEPGGKCTAIDAWRDKDGYSCEGHYDGAEAICINSRYCGWKSTFDNGSVCVGQGGTGACYGSYFTNGSICYANGPGACSGYVSADQYFDDTSCCCGNYCPKKAPKCSDRGIPCDPKYLP